MWMYKTRGLSFLFLTFSRSFLPRFLANLQLLTSTPYKLELTLEVLKLHRVISVSGIQYSRTDYTGEGGIVRSRCVGRCDN